MKFSFRQILASAAGAVLAALIASSFGVTGTIIGVAVGSMCATIGTAIISQSIERGHHAVKQVVVRVPEGSSGTSLLRRLGGTGAVGDASSSQDAAPTDALAGDVPTEAFLTEAVATGVLPTEVFGAVHDETSVMQSPAAPVDETPGLDITAVTEAPPTEHLEATALVAPAVVDAGADGSASGVTGRPGVWIGTRRFTWKAIAGTVAIVFVVALVFVTVVELIVGQPLSSIFGNSGTGPSISRIFNPSPPATSTTTTTTPSTTSTTGTSTTTTTTSSTTSTTSPSPSTSTTTNAGATTTTTPGANNTTTTTTTTITVP